LAPARIFFSGFYKLREIRAARRRVGKPKAAKTCRFAAR
jgi:hypothetical protein